MSEPMEKLIEKLKGLRLEREKLHVELEILKKQVEADAYIVQDEVAELKKKIEDLKQLVE